MYEKWYTNVFGVISLRGPPRGPTFFLAPPEKMLKSTVFELEQWFLHQNGPFFHQEFNGKGLWVLGSQFCTKKMKNISEFQNSWNFWIFGSWTQPGAWHMIVPFWSWNLSDTTHVRSHTKFQLIWAINTAFSRGGHNVPPPLTQMCSWDPLTIRVKLSNSRKTESLISNRAKCKCSFRIYIIFYHRRPFNKTTATLVRPHPFSTLCTTPLGKMTLWYVVAMILTTRPVTASGLDIDPRYCDPSLAAA